MINNLRKPNLQLSILMLSLTLMIACNCNQSTKNYSGTPFQDEVYKKGAQVIPGKLQCEYYDLGGEGIAFHDSDSVNSGSGALNEANGTYLHEFRMNEAVDISYTKFREPKIDNSSYNFVDPEKDQLYVGWTNPGEWIKYTIDVKEEGSYKLGLMFTSNKDGKIAFSVNDIKVTEPILIPSTYVEADTIAFRQWHHWNYLDNIARLELKKGLQTFTIHILEVGDMNYEHISFELIK